MISKKKIEGIRDYISDETGVNKIIITQGKYYPKNIPEFAMIFQAILKEFIYSLAPASAKILLYMLGKLDYSNHIGINQETMSEECKLSIPTVARSIKELLDNKIILAYKDTSDKRRNIYIINPYTAWKGTFNERKKAIKAVDKNQLMLFGKEEMK